MNSFARGIWFLLNVVLGAGLASILFYWVACDMQMPVMLTDFISTYLPVIKPAFDVPYVQISSISSSIPAKLLVDAFLCAIFGFAHTLFAQESVQLLLGRLLFPKQTLRTVYCIIVSVTVFLIMGLWQHTHVQLWNCLPATMSTFDRQLVLLIIYSIIYAPGNDLPACASLHASSRCPFRRMVRDHQVQPDRVLRHETDIRPNGQCSMSVCVVYATE